MYKLTERDSAVFTSMKTLAMLMVLLIHADLRAHGAAQDGGTDFYNEFFSLMLADGAVPAFFFISGFFLFRNYDFRKKLASRLHSLFVPYFVWCVWGLFLVFFLQRVLGLESLFSGNELKLLRDFTPTDYCRVFWDIRHGAPITSTLWFLRDLCVMVLLSPLVFRLLKTVKGGVILLLLCLYVGGVGGFVIGWGSLFFFSLGGYVAVRGTNLFRLFDRESKWIVLLAAVSLSASAGTYLAGSSWHPVVLRVWIICSIPVLYLVCRNKCIYASGVLGRLPQASFFVYLFHEPLMGYVQKLFYKIFTLPAGAQYVLYWLFPLLTLFVSLLVYHWLKRICPRFLSLITGKR